MKIAYKNILLIAPLVLLLSCGKSNSDQKTEAHEEDMHGVHLSDLKYQSLSMKTDSVPKKALSYVIEVNGQLEVPPQHEATVTAILGANITAIKVIEGDKVRKGQVLAYLSHPNLSNLQSSYISAYSQLQYLEQEKDRQEKLYKERVGAGKDFQQTNAEYQSTRGTVNGLASQLRQLGLSLKRLQDGHIYDQVPVVSPINGYVENVFVQIGQYAEPQNTLFQVVDNEHVHADLMVYEKDVHKIHEGQKVSFSVASVPDRELTAEVYSVGKKFEQERKALHLHAEIDQKDAGLIPGMYIKGKIHTGASEVYALPVDAFVEADGKTYIFKVEKETASDEVEWDFEPMEVQTGLTVEGWTEVRFLQAEDEQALVAWNNAYYLIAEMQKSQTSHHH